MLSALGAITMMFSYSQSITSPFRLPELKQLKTPIEVRDSVLFVDSNLANRLGEIRRSASSAGWEKNTPLVGLTYNWASLWPYLLEARVVPSLMVTIFANPGSLHVAEFNLDWAMRDFPLSKAWILITPNESLDFRQKSEVDSVINYMSELTKKEFLEDYQLVFSDSELQLYKPRELD